MKPGCKILIFTEGTLIIHKSWVGMARREMVDLVRSGQAPNDYAGSVPIGQAVKKVVEWQRRGAQIEYLTSRTKISEIEDVKSVLSRFGFPKGLLHFRCQDETYADVAERVMPDIIVEDDCESIGGEIEMTYPHIRTELKPSIRSVVVQEFGGIDHLPDDLYGSGGV